MPNRNPIELDVRGIPTWERHDRIFSLFDSLERAGELTITCDHEPRPLRAQFEERRVGQYVWLQRMLANDLWQVTLRRIPVPTHQESVARFLLRCALLADVQESTRALLTAAAVERTLTRGEAFAEESAQWEGFGVVREGWLSAIITSPYGRERGLYEVLPTESFGEVSALDGGVALARFEVESPHARVLIFPKPVVAEALFADSALVRALGAITAQRMRRVVQRLFAQTSLPTVARVAAALLPHAGPELGLQPALATLDHLTQVQIATAAGTVKEVVSRALMELEQVGAIERHAGRIAKVDREKLTLFSNRL